ncbi:MAG: hypothetical protein KGQ66_11830 [Acidobacteriota bacterium]|nr:hypothetical protein [Acidobacteriota bacterium]
MSRFATAIETARQGTTIPSGPQGTSTLHDGPEVQLSVRVAEGLRSAVASTASAQGLTVTAFVEQALQRAVAEASDSFVGLAADLARNVRAELRAAIEAGDYREAAAAVEREEAWS